MLLVKRGFTLIELIVVISIIAILAVIALGGFRSTQYKARDGQRKSDLKQIANALEVIYYDHGRYPDSDDNGNMLACPYDPDDPSKSDSCTWGSGEVETKDEDALYIRKLQEDPSSGNYFYRSFDNGQKYQLYARLENPNDPDLISDLPEITDPLPDCGNNDCNFAITSTNTTPSEEE